MKHTRPPAQFRYYEAPPDSNALALLGPGWIREYGNDLKILHFHNCLEIGYCHEGEGTMNFGGQKQPYTKESITIVPPHHLHHTNSRVGQKCRWEFLFLDMDSILNNQFPERPQLRSQFIERIYAKSLILQHDDHPQMANIILAIMEEYRHKGKYYKDNVRGLLQSLMVYLMRLHDTDGIHGVSASENIGAISTAIEYVAKHYHEKITVHSLAKACHLSETHFRRVFSQTMKISPQGYINLIRIEAVCKLLRTTNEPIGEIAVKCGFVTPSTLNRNFRDVVGMSPLQFRKDTQYYAGKLKDDHILPYEGWR